jgi:hypothetical protein
MTRDLAFSDQPLTALFPRDGARAAVVEPEIDGVPARLVGTTKDVPFYPVAATGPLLAGRYFPLL